MAVLAAVIAAAHFAARDHLLDALADRQFAERRRTSRVVVTDGSVDLHVEPIGISASFR